MSQPSRKEIELQESVLYPAENVTIVNPVFLLAPAKI